MYNTAVHYGQLSCDILAYVWTVKDIMYLIEYGYSPSEGITYYRVRMRQANQEENENP